MSDVLHPIEKKIIRFLKENPKSAPQKIESLTGLSTDQVRRGIEWLKLKGLANVKEDVETSVQLGEEGLKALTLGLPERRCSVFASQQQSITVEEMQNQMGTDCNPGIAHARQNEWITIVDGVVIGKPEPIPESPEEKLIKFIGNNTVPLNEIKKTEYGKKALELIKNRPSFVKFKTKKSQVIILEPKANEINLDEGMQGAIDVEAKVPDTFVARIHPLKEVINEVRENFVSLGFSEVLGNFVQPSFWNFDALFTPQDHPARDMQDSFYLKDKKANKFATSAQINQVSRSHKNGWRYDWSQTESKRMVLRTHTTCVTIKYLAENKPDEARIFSLGRVFRNEKVSYKHLFEFNQVEGIVVGKEVTLRDLMGIQREFYRKMGITKVKFWPTFFPYTEPSLQSIVYNERLNKWVELFGMGIFRPEVTKPLGITRPVLAWGGGIERIAMLKYEMDDVREFYNNNLSWLRSVT